MRPSIFFTFLSILLLVNSHGVHGQKVSLKLHAGGVSDRDLLDLRDAPKTRLVSDLGSGGPDTLRILAIRVEFQEDNNRLTTGNGKFDLSNSADPVLDPPPHDANYFSDQLLALRNYYKAVSRGKLFLDFEVFPEDVDGSYTVSQPMSFYTPVGSEEELDRKLSELFQESFQLADAADAIDFSQFDSFVIFHAGVGSDFALDFDPTPQDVPSVFLDFQTLKDNLGNGDPNYAGIPVQNNSFFIRDGILLPETQSQEDFEIGLLGTMAVMFGHQLGLPNLFNTDTGLPGIGVFGLMDQGSGNFSGLLPAEPCAWSKVFLGWEVPIEITQGEDFPVAASTAANPSKIYKIPISNKEYFLIENRQQDFANDNVAIGRDARGTRVEFRSDGQGQRILADGVVGVITQANEYDFGLPGSGILIWHIDENVIEASLQNNRVNADPQNRGVDLEEADGAQDIGQVYGLLHPAAGQENGTVFDMFWGSNDINMLVNDSSDVVAFTPTSRPSSLSSSGANTHIVVTNFSEPDSVMTFSLRNDFQQGGFPQFTDSFQGLRNSPIVADLDNDGLKKEVVLTSSQGTAVYVWNSDGSKFITNQDSVTIPKPYGTEEKLPLAVFARPPGVTAFSPALVPFRGQHLLLVATDVAVAAYLPVDADLNGRADSLFVFRENEAFATDPLIVTLDAGAGKFRVFVGTTTGDVLAVDETGQAVVLGNFGSAPVAGLAYFPENRIAFATRDGKVGMLTVAGDLLWLKETATAISRAPAVGDLNRDGFNDLVVATDEGTVVVLQEDGEALPDFRTSGFPAPSSQVALGDVDGDAYLDLVFVAEDKLYVYNHTGFLSNNFPVRLSPANSDDARASVSSSPILADLDDDGRPEIIVGTGSHQVAAFHSTGQMVSGFPLEAGQPVNSTPVVADLEGDGGIELAVASDDGVLHVWNLPGNYNPAAIPWGSYLHDAQHTNANLQVLQPSAPVGRLMPSKSVYNYPNPTSGNQTAIRYTLNFAADVKIRIFDLAGEFVDEMSGPGFAPAENEVVWGLDKVESGVYLARVEAKGAGMKDVVTFKIAVVK